MGATRLRAPPPAACCISPIGFALPMKPARWVTLALTMVVAVVMISTGAVMLVQSAPRTVPAAPTLLSSAGGSPSPTASSTSSASATPLTGAAAVSQRVHEELTAAGVPDQDVFLPNFQAPVSYANHVVTPLYSQAPAPMGVGDFGIQEVGGKNVGTVTYTPSVEGVLRLTALNDTYLDAEGPDEVSIQLNTVVTGVDLFGNSSYQFWIQNVPVYIPSLHQLSILDNVWNFSSPAFDFTQNSLYSSDGTIYAPVFYEANGPTWHTAMPFTIQVYNNATLYHNRPTVYENYSVTLSNGSTYSGSYDRIVFNSTAAPHQIPAASRPTFQIDGKQAGANGFLPNDAELMLGGSDDGDTTDVENIGGTMQLLEATNGTRVYHSVPAAYDIGTDTGETTAGVAEWASNGTIPTVHLGPGPSFVIPLWGLKGAAFGHIDQALAVHPANAFVFVSPGPTFQQGKASWAPVPWNGAAYYQLAPGTGVYSYDVLLSDYKPVKLTLNGSQFASAGLSYDAKLGVYTPLWASGNAQLAAISAPGGAGTRANPYVLDNGAATLSPLFGQFNDYVFPVFSGILLRYTDAYVTVTNAPSFLVQYSLPGQLAALAQFGLPSSNYLQLEFENTSHVSVVDNPAITGWFFADDGGLALGSLLLWNSSHDLVASNQFDDMGESIYLAGGSGNTFWGNTFDVSVPPAPVLSSIFNYGAQVGIQMFGSGNLVYNNYFDVPDPALTPNYAFSTYFPVTYHDTWNVTREPASVVRVVNGFDLSGNILGLSYQGGNFWSNYGSPSDPYGHLPYNDGQQINAGGDFVPLIPYYIHKIVFTESGLAAGTDWSVTILGVTESSRGVSLTLWEPASTYAYVVSGGAGATPSPASGAVTVANTMVTVPIVWT